MSNRPEQEPMLESGEPPPHPSGYDTHPECLADGWEPDGGCEASTKTGARCERDAVTLTGHKDRCSVHQSTSRAGREESAEFQVEALLRDELGGFMSGNEIEWQRTQDADGYERWHEAPKGAMRSRARRILDEQMPEMKPSERARLTSASVVAAIRPAPICALEAEETRRVADLATGQTFGGVAWANAVVRWGIPDGEREPDLLQREIDSGQMLSVIPPLPWLWGTTADREPTRFLGHLERIGMSDAEARYLCAWAGACLLGLGGRLRTMPVLLGPAGSGKSTILDVLTGLAGHAGHSLNTERALAPRFVGANLASSLITSIGDLVGGSPRGDQELTAAVSTLRSITGGDPIWSEPKGRQGRSVRNRVGIIAATNTPPTWARSSADLGAWLDRIALIECPNELPKADIEPTWPDDTVTLEGQALAEHCVRAFLADPKLPRPASIRDRTNAALSEALHPADQWVRTGDLRAHPGGKTSSDAIWAAYSAWHADQGLGVPDAARERRAVIRRINAAIQATPQRGTYWGWTLTVDDETGEAR